MTESGHGHEAHSDVPGTGPDDEEPALRTAGVWCEAGSVRAVIRDAVVASVERLEREIPRARAGDDPEGVHQARVALRRLRSDLRTFEPLLDRDWVRSTRGELRVLADALGTVRDADVLELRLRAGIDTIGIPSSAADRLLARLSGQRDAHRRRLLDVLDSDRTRELLAELSAAAEDPPTLPAAIGHARARSLPLVRRPWKRLRRAVAELGGQPGVAELHRVRLLAKRARYASEAVEPVFGRDARRFARAITAVQDVLGDMHDADVAARWLAGAVSDLDADAAFAAGRLAEHFRGDALERRHGWELAFARARRRSGWLD